MHMENKDKIVHDLGRLVMAKSVVKGPILKVCTPKLARMPALGVNMTPVWPTTKGYRLPIKGCKIDAQVGMRLLLCLHASGHGEVRDVTDSYQMNCNPRIQAAVHG